jgi:hypothetical protein
MEGRHRLPGSRRDAPGASSIAERRVSVTPAGVPKRCAAGGPWLPRLKTRRSAAWDCNLQALKIRQSKLGDVLVDFSRSHRGTEKRNDLFRKEVFRSLCLRASVRGNKRDAGAPRSNARFGPHAWVKLTSGPPLSISR